MLYHYTNIDGLKGIISNNGLKLWFTNYKYLNDSSEGCELKVIYDNILDQLFNDNKINELIYDYLKKINFEDKDFFPYSNPNKKLKVCEDEEEIYLCCFSRDGDSLPMWRYYSKNETGCSIELDDWYLREHWHLDALNPEERKIGKSSICEVVYPIEQKSEKIENLILNVVENLSELSEMEKAIKTDVLLEEYRFVFKNQCFESEKESRAILYIPTDNTKHPKECFEIKYRTNQGMLIPYIERELPIEALLSVRVSPMASDLAVESIKRYLYECTGRRDVVHKSELPVRF